MPNFRLAHVLELRGHLLLDAARDGAQLRVLLQRLAADVQRDVRRVHDAVHEVVVVGQKVRALLLDEHAGAIERKSLLVVLAVQVERRDARDEQQRVVADGALGVEAQRAQRLLPVVERGGVELVVVLLLHVGLALLPDGRHGVEGLELLVVLVLRLVVVRLRVGLRLLAALRHHHADGVAHVVGVLRHELAELPLAQELVGVVLLRGVAQEERDLRAVGALTAQRLGQAGLGHLVDAVAADAVGLPGVRDVLP